MVAVLASLVTSAAVFFLATVDVVILVGHIAHYADGSLSVEARMALRNQSITHVVEVMDGYLLATILLIFALGLYEIFISPFDEAREGGEALYFSSLDDLKNALARVILIILIVKLFEHALQMEIETALDLLSFAGSIALVGLALFLSHAGGGKKDH